MEDLWDDLGVALADDEADAVRSYHNRQANREEL